MWTDPRNWRLPESEGYKAYLSNLKVRSIPIAADWRGDGSIRPVDLYCYLKFRFGNPNGILTMLASPHSDNLFHWDYTLQSGADFIDILSGNNGTEIRLWSRSAVVPEDWTQFIGALKQEFYRNGRKLGQIRRSLEKWHIFVNPFRRLQFIIHNMVEDLESIELPALPVVPRVYKEKQDSEEVLAALNEYTRLAKQLSGLGLTIRYLCPVWAESFINLTIFTLAKPDIRRHEVYEEVIRAHIQDRVASLHETCIGFQSPVDMSSESIRSFLRMMNLRNHLLHGNIDPLLSTFDTVYFEGTRPIFAEEDNLAFRLARKANEWVAPDKAIGDVEVIEGLITHILECLEPSAAENLITIMGDSQPGWRSDTRRVGILFPSDIGMTIGYGGDQSAEADA